MGRASSAKKVARAAASGRRTRAVRQRSLTFPAIVAVVVVLGVAMVFAANQEQADADATPPQAGIHHWHVAFGIYSCDAYLPDLIDQNDPVGIHSHADGVIHIHPFLSRAAGSNARLDDFFEAVDMDADASRVRMPQVAGGQVLEAGSDCNGQPNVVRMLKWDSPDDTEPEVIEDDFGDFRFAADAQMLAIVVAPADAQVPVPPSTVKLTDLSLLDDVYPDAPNSGDPLADQAGTDGGEEQGDAPEGEGVEGEDSGDGETPPESAPEGATTVAPDDAATTTAAP